MDKKILIILGSIILLATFGLSLFCVLSNQKCFTKKECNLAVSEEIANLFLEGMDREDIISLNNELKIARDNNQCEANAYLNFMISSIEKTRTNAKDISRKADIRQIISAQELYYIDNAAYLSSETMPDYIGYLFSSFPKDPETGDNYGWIDNSKDPSVYCVYATLSDNTYFTASPSGTGERLTVPTLYDCEDDNNI
jgi:hypothetical protein